MDDIVKQAIAKWPNVPHCYGWLGLDARGNWYMRDDRVQALGPFAGGGKDAKGSMLKHEKLVDFIARNYESDAQGQWFFQNGPQRVYVELEDTPLVWRVADDHSIVSHAGKPARPQRILVDEKGRLYIDADIGFGLVHTQDMNSASDAVEKGLWVPEAMSAEELPARFGYVRSPAALRAAA